MDCLLVNQENLDCTGILNRLHIAWAEISPVGGSEFRRSAYKARDSFIVDLSSDTHTFRIQYDYDKTQCVGVVQELNNHKTIENFKGDPLISLDFLTMQWRTLG